MIMTLAIVASLFATPPAIDNGFTSELGCTEISWPTLPISVRSSLIQGPLVRQKFEDAVDYWNGIGIGDVFELWDPDLVLEVPDLLITATQDAGATIIVHYTLGSCLITGVELILPINASYKYFVHGLGRALGLEPDFGLGSLMQNPLYYTDLGVDVGAVIVTTADKQRILDAVIY